MKRYRKPLPLRKKEEAYRKRIAATPKVEKAYKSLVIERDSAQAKYGDLLEKLMEARVAQGLEKEQKGEHFSLIEPARLPEDASGRRRRR